MHSHELDLKRKWAPAGSEGLDHSQLWLRPEQNPQILVPKLSSTVPVAPEINPSPRSARGHHCSVSRLFQKISQAEISSKQWSDIHANLNQICSDLAGQRDEHDQNGALASSSERAMTSEDRSGSVELRQGSRSSDVEQLRRARSLSSEDVMGPDFRQVGHARSLSCSNSNIASKNLISERKRRKKLNDGLYSLRALVPKISKMDKASIVGDAIEHVKELQQQIESIESEIAEMESKYSANSVPDEDSGGSMTAESGERASIALPLSTGLCEVANPEGEGAAAYDDTVTVASIPDATSDSQDRSTATNHQKILKMDVAKLEDQMYQLQISCQRGPGVLVQLTQALESLDFDVLNAYYTSFQESILNTFIVEIKSSGEAEDVRNWLLDAVAQHGLVN